MGMSDGYMSESRLSCVEVMKGEVVMVVMVGKVRNRDFLRKSV